MAGHGFLYAERDKFRSVGKSPWKTSIELY